MIKIVPKPSYLSFGFFDSAQALSGHEGRAIEKQSDNLKPRALLTIG